MAQTTKATHQNRTIIVDFQDPSTYFQLISDGKAFVEFVLAFILSLGGSVSKVEMVTPMTLIYKVLCPSISTFETPPGREWQKSGCTPSASPRPWNPTRA